MRVRALVPLLGVLGLASALWAAGRGPEPFPHALHAGLFPVCTGCHAGVVSGDSAALFPSATACATCHDGRRLLSVTWTPPSGHATNLRFSHAAHAARLLQQGRTAACGLCHTADSAKTTGATMRALTVARPEACITCHAHQAASHLAEGARCRTCHLPLSRAVGLDTAWVAHLPRPASHGVSGFLLQHRVSAAEAAASCAVCHARESCQRCHANGATVPAIAALDSDARVARLAAGRPASYPLPPSHKADWQTRHANTARSGIAECANCHLRDDCRSCHSGEGAQRQIALLPSRGPGGPAGALAGTSPAPRRRDMGGAAGDAAPLPREGHVGPHPAGFAETHGTAAAAGALSCAGCHAESYCSSCHAGASRPGFHPANFMARHGADAYGGARNCNSCHNTETFCKTCHLGEGVATGGRTGLAYHDGQPLWLLQHGEAARKGLAGCTACHRQQDCIQCHSASGGWAINPHGPGFDAARMSDRNQLICARCHVSTPQ